MIDIIQKPINCSSAKEFIDTISPIGVYFHNLELSNSWLFRGQGQDYPIIPSLFRKNGKLGSLTNRDLSKIDQRLLALRDFLIQFFEIADKRGLFLPDDSQDLRSLLETLNSRWGDNSVPNYYGWEALNKTLSLEALAQHYGIPTRLVDWTKNSFIAAFFAAEDALNNKDRYENSSSLVVWGFYFPALGRHYEISRLTDPIRIVTAPSATNPNLKAQQGIFTLLNFYNYTDEEGKYLSMEELLTSLGQEANPDQSDADKLIVDCKLQKFTLPITEASELLYLLAKLDITPSAIYPGFHSILRELQMHTVWSKSTI